MPEVVLFTSNEREKKDTKVEIWSRHFMGNRWGNSGNSVKLYFFGAPKSLQMVIAAIK